MIASREHAEMAAGAVPAEVVRGLANAVAGDVRFGAHDRLLYATDASIYQVEPLGVVIPTSADDAVAAVRYCARHGLPILPRGGGTSLAGQCVNRAVVLDASAGLLEWRDLDAESATVYAESGVCVDDLNAAVVTSGLHFAPDPSTTRQATIGGCIGNNAAGMHSVLFGRTSENVEAIDACLADGHRVTFGAGAAAKDPVVRTITHRVIDVVERHASLIRERFPKTLRRSAGYQLDVVLQQLDAIGTDPHERDRRLNLASLLCGSEGTLAVTLGATVELRKLPRSKGLAVVAFDDLDAAIAAVGPLLETGPSAIELLDDLLVDVARKNSECRRYVELLPAPAGASVRAVLYVEYFKEEDGETFANQFASLRERFGDAWVETHTDAGSMRDAWALRRAGEPLLHGIDPVRKPLGFVEDNAIPPARLSEFVRKLRVILTRHGTTGSFYAHASVGVLHVRPLLDLKTPSDKPKMLAIATEAAALAKSLGGVMSGEHGDGRARGPFLPDYFGDELMAAFGEIKAIFDPKGLLNPGAIVSPRGAETIVEDLRLEPGAIDGKSREVRTPAVETYYEYEDQHGFDGAVEMCNGAGVCRKKTGGTMCPSYMGTLDERHSTRGRGNALRLAITGQLAEADGPAWEDAETAATLDLCLSCKACKSECPSNVDIARLKAEYTAQRYRARRERGEGVLFGGATLQAQLFGRIGLLSRLAGLAPGVTNVINRSAWARPVLNRALGLHSERSLPGFAKPLHRQWVRDRGASDRPTVALYADTFTTYNEPGIGLAARRVLEGFGYRVVLYRGTDAARAMMSVGLLDDAIAAIERELPALDAVASDERVEAIVFCEPSVLSAVVDDWRMLKVDDGDGAIGRIARKSLLVERFLSDNWGRHPRRPGFVSPGRVVLHEHCHQKALPDAIGGAGSSAGVLELAFGSGVVEQLDAGCCGMAGSFGYTRDRYGLSMKIGEHRLFPAVRSADDAVISASGTSCRHQVLDGTGRHGLHPIEVLEKGMVDAAEA